MIKNNYGVFFCILSVISMGFAMTGKTLIEYAPTIGWFLAIIFNLLAIIMFLKKTKK
jgi:uncharacterized membrane protein